MPFMDIDRPSIQLGLLNAIAKAHDFPSRTMHANLDFAARIGEDYYRALSEHRGVLLGDWLFSLAAFGDTAPDPDSEFLDEFSEKIRYISYPWADLRARLLKTRHQDVPAYLESIAEDIVWNNTRLVGFTSTFQQNSASLALARLLKERYPNMIILFGGANFDGDMVSSWCGLSTGSTALSLERAILPSPGCCRLSLWETIRAPSPASYGGASRA